MIPRSRNFNGLQKSDYSSMYSYYDPSTTPWTRREIVDASTVYNTNFAFADILTCSAGIVKGNFHSPNGFSFTKTIQSGITGLYTQYKFTGDPLNPQGWERYVNSGPVGSSAGITLPLPSDQAYNKALGKLNEKLRGQVDLSVDLAQAGQVKRMIRDTARLERYTKGFSRKTIANKWLEFVYGWKPLAQSLHGSLEQLYSMANATKRCTVRASVGDKVERTSVDPTWRITTKEDCNVRILLSIDYSATSPNLDLASRLTSLNPVSIAWELVPYSFVVDWFYDVGGFLRDTESYLVASTGKLSNGYKTETSIRNSKVTWLGNGKVPNSWETVGSVSGFTTVKSFNRSLLPFWPLPRPPVFKADLGTSRLFSAASLLAQHLGLPPDVRTPKRTITTEKWSSASRELSRISNPSLPQFRKR